MSEGQTTPDPRQPVLDADGDAVYGPRQEFELAMGRGIATQHLSPTCIRAIRNNLSFDAPTNGDYDMARSWSERVNTIINNLRAELLALGKGKP